MSQTTYSEIVKNNKLDLWICLYFKVLPTSLEYKQLLSEQKHLLFTGFLDLPTSEQIKLNHEGTSSAPRITSVDTLNLKKLGYSQETIDRMQGELQKAFT